MKQTEPYVSQRAREAAATAINSMEMNTNPYAFPNSTMEGFTQDGMTLRDWFAGQALVGLLSNAEAVNSDGWSWRTGTLAGDAYKFADDMLEARKHD